MIRFILNNETIAVDLPAGTTLLDYIRYHKDLTGTKIGCREGDCGACTIMVGTLHGGEVKYTTATSCLMAIGNAQGKHIVSIEGVNPAFGLSPVQEAFATEGATQCGFCTPGFIMSLTNYCVQDSPASPQGAIDAMNGNICRCTGYKSIERAAGKLCEHLSKGKPGVESAIKQMIVHEYFKTIPARLKELAAEEQQQVIESKKILAGGTDLYVQQHDSMTHAFIRFVADDARLKVIEEKEGICYMGGAVTVTDIAGSAIFKKAFPALADHIKLISSTQIRNMATLAGNMVNASPIGDLSIFFLALDAQLILEKNNSTRQVPLRSFYKGYKKMDLQEGELLTGISFPLPSKDQYFNFEKVCKRSWLDIASVNTALSIEVKDETIAVARIAAGGVAPIPFYLEKASEWLTGKKISNETLAGLLDEVQKEISPISDVRGSEKYKRLLLSQLIKAHFLQLFPGNIN